MRGFKIDDTLHAHASLLAVVAPEVRTPIDPGRLTIAPAILDVTDPVEWVGDTEANMPGKNHEEDKAPMTYWYYDQCSYTTVDSGKGRGVRSDIVWTAIHSEVEQRSARRAHGQAPRQEARSGSSTERRPEDRAQGVTSDNVESADWRLAAIEIMRLERAEPDAEPKP